MSPPVSKKTRERRRIILARFHEWVRLTKLSDIKVEAIRIGSLDIADVWRATFFRPVLVKIGDSHVLAVGRADSPNNAIEKLALIVSDADILIDNSLHRTCPNFTL